MLFVRQEDEAGPHDDNTYSKFIEDEVDERGWTNF